MISAVILTHNSRETLSATLTSVSFCDERIVIDDYSTDDTIRVAKEHNALVYQRHLGNDFSSQRNFGLSKVKNDWIVFVDSDEIVPEALKREMLGEISRKGERQEGIAGYFLKRQDIFLGKPLRYGETAHVKLLRLAKKNAGVWTRPIHEIWDVTGPTKILDTPLIHYAHTDVAQFVSDINRYTTINAQYLFANHQNVGLGSIVAYPIGKFFQNYFF